MLRPQTTGGSLTHLSVTHTGQTPRVLSRDSSVGFSLHCTFYGHNADDALFRDISKIKVMDVHPTLPWVLTVDERLRVTVWDYVRRRTVREFNPQDIKDRQHDDYELASAAAKLPEYSGRRAKLLSLRERPRSFSSASLDISGVSEDDGSSRFKVGAAKSCRFYDAGALRWRCGCQPVKQAGSVSWIVVVLENGVMMVDYQTNEVREVRPGALGKAKLLSAEPVSAKHLALGCSDGVVRLWDWTKGAVASTCTGAHDKSVVDIISLPPDRDDTSTAIRFVSAGSDASVAVWRIACPNGAVPNNAEPATTLPPSGGSFVSMTLDSVTSELLLLTSDRRATLWGGTTAKLIPSTVSARVVSSKGARLTLALPATSHRFPHRALLTCTNHSPVIELLVPGWAAADGRTNGGGGTCIEVVDIRTLRDGLPEKTKIYCMQVHPLQPFNIICGTNVGLFVIHMDATATVAGVALTHPLWTPEWLAKVQVGGGRGGGAGGSNTPVAGRIADLGSVDDGPVPVVGAGAEAGGDNADDGAPEAKVNAPDPLPSHRSQLVMLYTDSTSLRAVTVEPGAGTTPTTNGVNGVGAGAGAGAGAGSGSGSGGSRPGTPSSGPGLTLPSDEVAISVADDSFVCGIAPAMSALQAAGKGSVGGSVSAHALHQASSGRSRRSGESGKSPVITGSPLWGPAELSVSGSGRHVGVVWPAIKSYAVFRVGSRADGESGLAAVEVDSGNGVALAWAAPGAWGGNEFDRFAVMEPEFLPQLPPTTHKRSSKDPEPPPPPAIPPSLVLRQLQGGVAFKVLPEVPTQRPPASVFGGPLLGVVLSDKDAEGTRVRGHAGTGGGLLEMQFYTWEPHAPKPKDTKHRHSSSKVEGDGDDAGTTGSQRIKSAARELTAVGSRFAAPLEVSWDTTKLRVALCYAEHTHVLAVRTGTAGGGDARGRRGRRRGGNRASSVGLQLQYLCQVSHQQDGFATPLWHQHTLFLATQSSVVVVFPNRPSKGTSPGATVVTIASHSPPPMLSASVPGTAAAAPATAEAAAAGSGAAGSTGDDDDDGSGGGGTAGDPTSSLHPVAKCARVGGCAPLGVLLGRLVVALWAGGGVHVSSLPLNAPLTRMGMLAAAGSPSKAVEWVGALPPSLHDAAARFLASQGLVGAAVRLPRVSVVTALPLALLHGDVSYVRDLVARGADAVAAADWPASHEAPHRPLAWDDADAMASPGAEVVPWRPPAVANRPPALHCVALFLAASMDDLDDAPALLRALATSCLACGRPNAAAFCASVARAVFAADGDDSSASDAAATTRVLLDSLVAAGRWHQAAQLAAALNKSRTAPPGAPSVQDVVEQWNAALSAAATPGSGVGHVRMADA